MKKFPFEIVSKFKLTCQRGFILRFKIKFQKTIEQDSFWLQYKENPTDYIKQWIIRDALAISPSTESILQCHDV